MYWVTKHYLNFCLPGRKLSQISWKSWVSLSPKGGMRYWVGIHRNSKLEVISQLHFGRTKSVSKGLSAALGKFYFSTAPHRMH